jgi:hypothetical protein
MMIIDFAKSPLWNPRPFFRVRTGPAAGSSHNRTGRVLRRKRWLAERGVPPPCNHGEIRELGPQPSLVEKAVSDTAREISAPSHIWQLWEPASLTPRILCP